MMRGAWTALRGAKKYVDAIARGDIALPQVTAARLAVCGQCPHATRHPLYPNLRLGYCGPAFDDRMAETPPTCGCLIAGKARVGGENCPQNRWAE